MEMGQGGELIAGLHTSARHYAERRRAGSDHARYRVLAAIQEAVEEFVPEDFHSLDEARRVLAEVAAAATPAFGLCGAPGERRVVDEERALFRSFLLTCPPDALRAVPPLPFRRTLTQAERLGWRDHLGRTWNAGRGYWYPLNGRLPEAEHLVAVASELHAGCRMAELRDAMAERGVRRVFELREHDVDASAELDVALFDPVYTMSEGYWFDRSSDWLVYASHENTVTVAGAWLVAVVKAAWPDWAEHSG